MRDIAMDAISDLSEILEPYLTVAASITGLVVVLWSLNCLIVNLVEESLRWRWWTVFSGLALVMTGRTFYVIYKKATKKDGPEEILEISIDIIFFFGFLTYFVVWFSPLLKNLIWKAFH